MLKKINSQDLIFPVRQSKLKVILDDTTIVTAEKYVSIHQPEKKELFGIKPLGDDRKEAFYMKHEEALNGLRLLHHSLFPWPISERCYATDNKNLAFVFFGKGSEGQSQGNLFDEESKLSFLPANKEETTLDVRFDWHYFTSNGFTPALAVENGFDYNDRAVFYLLVEIADNIGRSGYITIDKYRIQSKTVEEVERFPLKKVELVMNELERKAAPIFFDRLKAFIHKYEALRKIQTNKEEVIAVALDVFNKNRNVESILSDTDLEKELTRFIENARSYFNKNSGMQDIVNFIIRYNMLNFYEPELAEHAIREVLVEKKAFGNLNRLIEGKNINPVELRNYVEEQVRVLRAI